MSIGASHNVRVSVVIPCRNEESSITDCVNSILRSKYPDDLIEIFVCDGLSTDHTPGIVQAIAEDHNNVKLLKNDKQTTPHALNLGVEQSTGEIIIILGAHAAIDEHYIPTCVASLTENADLGCVGGVLDNTCSDSRSRAIAQAMSLPFGVGPAHFRTGARSGYVDTVAFGAYKAEVFSNVGNFNEHLVRNQDDEFNYRVTQAGYKILLNPDIRAIYHVRADFGKLWSQYYQYGYWKVYVNKLHSAITTSRQLVPMFFVLFLMAMIPLSWVDQAYLWVLLMGLAAYLVGALISALSKTVNMWQVILIIISFICLHISYGFGYMVGILHFIVAKRSFE